MKRLLVFALLTTMLAPPAAAQLGQLLSPGPLARAHADLEGADNCVKCHEQGRRVSAARCLACHKPVAERIARKRGVHRDVVDDCVACHVEHAGRDAELRPFDVRTFDHRAETGFSLDGRHAALKCAQCHVTRSYLALRAECGSCHKDPHNGRLGSDCARCHPTSTSFKEASRAFDHSKAAFPLEGAHRNVPCAKCHPQGQYKGVRHASCTDCHKSPHKSNVGDDCRSCHTAASWKVASFDHAKTGTPLAGRHRNLACGKCHVRPPTQARLKLRPCAACHKDPHRGAFRQDCAACHDENGFRGAPFDHAAKTKFPLQGKHRTAACSACHKRAGDFRGLSTPCVSCHKDPHNAQLGTACEQCHTAESFRIARYQHPRFAEFFGGQHAAVKCDQCHRGAVQSRVYRNLSTECVSCHRDVHNGQFPRCTDCHTVEAAKFAPERFDHAKTAFPLTGKHTTVPCAQCHPKGAAGAVYRGTATACASCHKDPHQGQLDSACERCHTVDTFRVERYTHRNPGAFFRGKHATAQCGACHKRVGGAVRFTNLGSCVSCHEDPHGGQFGPACANCHQVDAAWSNASRAFHKAGLFPLEGRHLVTPCGDCHVNGIIKGTPTRCYDCHWVRRQDDVYRTRLGNECEDCHRPTAWSAVTWDHGARTTFALAGAHRTLACDQCHHGDFGRTLSDCASCHAADYDGAREPLHRAAGFPMTCQLCHRPGDTSWRQARFDHTAFTLAGVHASQTCGACHGGGVYAGTPRDCVGCHRGDYDRSADPAHAAAGFSLACDTCHRYTDARWSDFRYAHAVWPLIGAHIVPRCSSCHAGGAYAGRPTDCVSCHRTDYDRSADPNHVSAGFPLTCEPCHQLADASWSLGRFTHETFPLAGVHLTQLCGACHKNNVYAGTARDCAGCHQAEYNAAQDPNHVAAAFPMTCESCHRFNDPTWDEGTYSHTTFALLGVHATQLCGACHRNNVYAGTSRICSGCHQADFNGAQDPNHVAAAFPTTCDTCHKYTDTSWDQGVFNHATFPLQGVHATQPCGECHVGGVYAGTPRTCAGCHQSDYNGAQDPNHVAAGFPTTCDTCHRYIDTSWDQGVFNHTTFPLQGVHATQPCGECHVGGVYAGTPRTCAGCHQSDYNAAQDPNHVAAGFPTTCDTCHRYTDTSWDQGVFDHATFPLQGVHATRPCGECHVGGVYAGTPRTCAGCHLDDYTRARDPNHVSAGFPTTCDTCHRFTDTSWDQGTFNHTWFPITSGDHANRSCDECHTTPGAYTLFSCITGCHDRADTDDEHQDEPGYRYDSLACYSCHPQGRAD